MSLSEQAETFAPTSRHGHDPAVMRRLQGVPLFGVNGFAINAGYVHVAGIALPPDGRADGLRIGKDAGISAELIYPTGKAPQVADYYWYWPNADQASFLIKIDLAATRHKGPGYKLRLLFDGAPEDVFEDIRTTIVVPKGLGAYQNYPSATALKRVQFFDEISGVAVKGATDAVRIARLAEAYGVDPAATVLDWGSGHGRVVRHLRLAGLTGDLHGIDIDPENVAWARAHLPGIRFVHGPLMPPTGYADATFDLLYGISVMTHLNRAVQEAWLAEIARILKPDGVAMLTFHGDAAVAFQSRSIKADWMATYLETGTAPDMPDGSLVGVIEQPDYYKNVYQTAESAAELCARYLEVVGLHKCMFGYQDLIVMRKSK